MRYNHAHTIVLEKFSQRALQDAAIINNMEFIATVNNKSLARVGWMITPQAPVRTTLENDPRWTYQYEMTVLATFSSDEKDANETALKAIANTIASRARNTKGGLWAVTHIDGEEFETSDEGERLTTKDVVTYTDIDIPDNWDENFGHLFGLDSYIGRMKAAVNAAIMSDWRNRFHVAFIGPPGCGKSDLCQSLRRALGSEAVMEFDATSTTAAGAIKDLDERDILPRILIVEEIEKANEATLQFLLSVMDMRAEIRKVTARKSVVKETKLLVIATVNDEAGFERMMSGALASRFANKMWFKRPTAKMVRMILTREIEKIGGDLDWITPVMEYAQKRDITDPRTILALCLCGQDMWLDGSYAAMLDATDKPKAA